MSEILIAGQRGIYRKVARVIWKHHVGSNFKWGIDYSHLSMQDWEENNKPKIMWKQN
jgi:hypothetical protein